MKNTIFQINRILSKSIIDKINAGDFQLYIYLIFVKYVSEHQNSDFTTSFRAVASVLEQSLGQILLKFFQLLYSTVKVLSGPHTKQEILVVFVLVILAFELICAS